MALFRDGRARDPKWQDRAGGYFCLTTDDGTLLLLCPFGNIPLGKFAKYAALSQEKAQRLAAHPEHASSWQSRSENDADLRFGGAIRANGYIYSFSGLPELGDEAVMLVTALLTGASENERSQRAIEDIAEMSRNPFFAPLRQEAARRQMNTAFHQDE